MKNGSKDRYFQNNVTEANKFGTGRHRRPGSLQGTLRDTVYQLVGGIRQSMGYIGAKLPIYSSFSHFVRITNAGLRESHPHDVTITKKPRITGHDFLFRF